MKTIIVEISGGVVQEVYTDAEDLRVILLDWDKGESPGDDYEGGELRPQALSAMPNVTKAAISALAP